jgi:hypothetical protein
MNLTPGFSQNARVPYCSFCGGMPGKTNPLDPTSADLPVVTTDLDISFEGIVEFCQQCAAEAGALSGMIPEKTAQELRTEAALARSAAISAEAERDSARKALDALREDLANRTPAPAAPAKTPAKKAAQRATAAA